MKALFAESETAHSQSDGQRGAGALAGCRLLGGKRHQHTGDMQPGPLDMDRKKKFNKFMEELLSKQSVRPRKFSTRV